MKINQNRKNKYQIKFEIKNLKMLLKQTQRENKQNKTKQINKKQQTQKQERKKQILKRLTQDLQDLIYLFFFNFLILATQNKKENLILIQFNSLYLFTLRFFLIQRLSKQQIKMNMQSEVPNFFLSQEQIQQEIDQINFKAIQRLIPKLKQIILVCKITKLLEFADVWHTKQKGPSFLVEEYSHDQKRKYTLIQLNQVHQSKLEEDIKFYFTKDMNFGFNDEQQMIYLKNEKGNWGIWIAEQQEYKNLNLKLQEIVQYVKS
ncbi:transmembrane protein, putative (macronuclear) [Tetrahymena thermophila SB210]|uniref:Transmembrane protein, putative n=1 Tax=Tetrahymena thermophila (strain SB210) TaxID=312017 RepID=Q24HN2_TETTS|nr:transmembrane protein, putative [Tetrahymena thermophila SB210]EAS07279.2 transmembrane protein, putative [Tetrahymena thermophila SB210]|eukprot:XP_001027521.2 transmembrane protein, putative [Tetrahymena thermophila SB210]